MELATTTHTAAAFRRLEAAGYAVTIGTLNAGAVEVDAWNRETGTTVAIRVAPRSGRLTAAALFPKGASVAARRARGAAPAAKLIREVAR